MHGSRAAMPDAPVKTASLRQATASEHVMASTSTAPRLKDLGQKVLLANKDHQYALRVYTERLEAELETVDKLLASAAIWPRSVLRSKAFLTERDRHS